mgnify:CR=1 FL=1
MFCPQCGVTTDAHIKYCKACGFKLMDFGVQQAITATLTPAEAKSQLHRLKGTRTLAAGLLLWLPSLFTMMVAASEHGPDQEIAATITFFFVLVAFVTNGWGLFNLWRGGFFKTYKEQRVRAEAALLAAGQEPARFAAKSEPVRLPAQHEVARLIAQQPLVPPTSSIINSSSVVEHTTRELHSQPSNSGKIS